MGDESELYADAAYSSAETRSGGKRPFATYKRLWLDALI
jgi:hypothetical protein|tara:strand:+ start:201 stop:317 length:117 start_codon:yes stop_codon:yes gene_type:complete